MSDSPLDDARCEALARLVVSGDEAAARELVALLWPHWVSIAHASKALRASPTRDDDAREVATRLVEKLGRPRSRELSQYTIWKQRYPDKTFSDWLRIVTANVVRDVARARGGRPSGGAEPSVKRLLNELSAAVSPDDLGTRPPITAAQTARQLIEYAEAELPEVQARALGLWLAGELFDAVASKLGLASAGDAQRAVRAAIATLRRRFGDG